MFATFGLGPRGVRGQDELDLLPQLPLASVRLALDADPIAGLDASEPYPMAIEYRWSSCESRSPTHAGPCARHPAHTSG